MVTMVILLSCSEKDLGTLLCTAHGGGKMWCMDFTEECPTKDDLNDDDCSCLNLINDLAESDAVTYIPTSMGGVMITESYSTCTDYCASCYYDTITDEHASTYGDSWVRCYSDSVSVINPITWIQFTYRCDTLQVN